MEHAYRQTVVIGPEGTFEGRAPGLVPRTTAEVIVLFKDESEIVPGPVPFSATSPDWETHWTASDRLIAQGMETWDLDRVNSEIAERRGGIREIP